ncbi:hypothetical protein PUN28_002523 [Cardiocondyla obscurior]|uniref:Uncharacterized protein n=1 Tax=Cardiocondyla obscurior TaxID=286306 RepID=A0AAW2GUZ0_9HYME
MECNRESLRSSSSYDYIINILLFPFMQKVCGRIKAINFISVSASKKSRQTREKAIIPTLNRNAKFRNRIIGSDRRMNLNWWIYMPNTISSSSKGKRHDLRVRIDKKCCRGQNKLLLMTKENRLRLILERGEKYRSMQKHVCSEKKKFDYLIYNFYFMKKRKKKCHYEYPVPVLYLVDN